MIALVPRSRVNRNEKNEKITEYVGSKLRRGRLSCRSLGGTVARDHGFSFLHKQTAAPL